jgi:3-phenylpropionate/trans-cinnamate dioxygenase ferredoxin reductase subunit
MEYAGYVEPDGYDQVVFRGDVGSREFIAFWLGDGGRVLADQALVRSGKPISAQALGDTVTPLESLA